jgi:RNA polymerase sigma factor (sigma-70 family)
LWVNARVVNLGRMAEVTRILRAVEQGDVHAAEALLPLVYEELRQLAARKLAHEAPGQTLDPTALVHEAYLRLVGASRERERPEDSLVPEDPPVAHAPGSPEFANRGHFFAAAAEAMRRILIESARRKQSLKRGGGRRREDLDDVDVASSEPSEDVLAVDEALTRLAARDPVKAELVKLRYFAGLSLPDAARVLGISTSTADRYWAYARAWLYREMTRG